MLSPNSGIAPAAPNAKCSPSEPHATADDCSALSRGSADGTGILDDVLNGLGSRPKSLPPKLFYDERGSRLFEQICHLGEYYLFRAETDLMRAHAAAIARLLDPGCAVIELGSGNSTKTRILLDALAQPTAYVPIDVSGGPLMRATAAMPSAYPGLQVLPVAADFTRPLTLPELPTQTRRRLVYFPGSTIGNLTPTEARGLLRHIAESVGPDGGLLVGVDTVKSPAVLHAAYNDAIGVTAAFNLNVLARINRELGTDLDVGAFRHHATYNEVESRIEMHLECCRAQRVQLAGCQIAFEAGERILTEYSYKYSMQSFRQLAISGAFLPCAAWTDARGLFSVHWLVPAARRAIAARRSDRSQG